MRVVDVYEEAAAIGKEFERVIERFGGDAVQHLMPRVLILLPIAIGIFLKIFSSIIN